MATRSSPRSVPPTTRPGPFLAKGGTNLPITARSTLSAPRAAKPETGRSPRGRVSSRDQSGAEEEKARPKGAVHEQHQRARAAQGVVLDKDQEKAFDYSHEGLPGKAASTHCSQVASNLDGAARIGGSHPLPATARWDTGPARLRRAGVQVPGRSVAALGPRGVSGVCRRLLGSCLQARMAPRPHRRPSCRGLRCWSLGAQ